MTGQMSIFDYIEPPKKFRKELFFADGYREVVEFDEPTYPLHGFDELRARHGMIVDSHTLEPDFDRFRSYCRHQMGRLKFGDDEEASPGCCFKDEKPARNWDDWQKCNYENCPFFKKGDTNETDNTTDT